MRHSRSGNGRRGRPWDYRRKRLEEELLNRRAQGEDPRYFTRVDWISAAAAFRWQRRLMKPGRSALLKR